MCPAGPLEIRVALEDDRDARFGFDVRLWAPVLRAAHWPAKRPAVDTVGEKELSFVVGTLTTRALAVANVLAHYSKLHPLQDVGEDERIDAAADLAEMKVTVLDVKEQLGAVCHGGAHS